ncbi:hypothetical protein ACFX2A_022157 [Malus domestica]
MVSDASTKKAAATKRCGKAATVALENGAYKLTNGVKSMHISDRNYTRLLCSYPLSSKKLGIGKIKVWKVICRKDEEGWM